MISWEICLCVFTVIDRELTMELNFDKYQTPTPTYLFYIFLQEECSFLVIGYAFCNKKYECIGFIVHPFDSIYHAMNSNDSIERGEGYSVYGLKFKELIKIRYKSKKIS